jgi:ACS family hexuronate transporter-like MFS transporter
MKMPRGSGAWAICGLLLLATLLNYMDRQALAVTLPILKQDYNLAESRVGVLEGCFGLSFAFGSILFGFLADRVGPKLLYPAVLTGWSLAGVATAFAGQPWLTLQLESAGDPAGTGSFYWLLGCRIVLGMCEAGHWPCALLTVRAVLSSEDRTLGNGILQSGASIGAIIVPLYIEAADRAGQSWEFPFWSIGLMGLTWIPLWFLLTWGRDLSRPSQKMLNPARDETLEASGTFPSDLIRKMLALGILIATLTVSWQFLRAWMGLLLQDYHGYSKEMTRGLMSGYFIAADTGCLLSGALVTGLTGRGWSLNKARLFGIVVFTLLTAAGACMPFAGNSWLMVVLMYVAGAGILGLHPFYYALAQELSLSRMGLLSGILAAFGWVVSSLSQILLGQHIEATQSYQLGLVIVGLAPLLGLVGVLLFWPFRRPAAIAD